MESDHSGPARILSTLSTLLFLVACGPSDGGSDGAGAEDAYQAPQPAVAVSLEGESSASGLPLSARVEAFVEDDRTLRLRVNNTSPDASSSVEGGPLLFQVGFNVAGELPASCLEVTGRDGRPAALRKAPADASFCRVDGKADASEESFVVELTDAAGAPGITRAETRDLILRLGDGCETDFTFSEEALLQAPRSTAGGKAVQWAGSFTDVGVDGADVGCVLGDGARAPTKEPVDRIWTNFVAATAEVDPLPSAAQDEDTRAGSLEVRFDDDVDSGGFPVRPDDPMAVATLRNGAGDILEQWHLNDRWPPETIGPDDCDTAAAHPRCYVYPEAGTESPVGMSIELPHDVRDSNAGFDEPGKRAEVSGTAAFRAVTGAPTQRYVRVRWTHPESLSEARLNLRAQSDGNLDGSSEDDPFVILYRARWPGSGEDLVEPPVTVVEETETAITVEVDVDAARDFVVDAYGER